MFSAHSEKSFLGVVPPIVPAENYTVETDRSCAVFINPVPYKGLDIVLHLFLLSPTVVVSRAHDEHAPRSRTRHGVHTIVNPPLTLSVCPVLFTVMLLKV